MNKNISRQWTAALRSGEYKQGQGMLRNDGGDYCCLGVLCDLARKAGVLGEWQSLEGGGPPWGAGMYQDTLLLPERVWTWAGFVSGGGFRDVFRRLRIGSKIS